MKLKYEYNCILGDQINNLLLKLRQKQFEMGGKPRSGLGLVSLGVPGPQGQSTASDQGRASC